MANRPPIPYIRSELLWKGTSSAIAPLEPHHSHSHATHTHIKAYYMANRPCHVYILSFSLYSFYVTHTHLSRFKFIYIYFFEDYFIYRFIDLDYINLY